MKKILALDPGGTTGWALYQDMTVEGDQYDCPPAIMSGDFYTIGQIGPEEHHGRLWHLFQHQQPTMIVCESFEFRQFDGHRTGIRLDSKEYIGLVKLWRELEGTPVVFQTASLGKTFCTDDKIKALNLWTPGHKHAMDAMRHLLTYMVQRERRYDIARNWKDL